MSIAEICSRLKTARDGGLILPSTLESCERWLNSNPSPVVAESISELVQKEQWVELNDRFYKTLAFGTGGIRGRTIGKWVTAAERGKALDGKCPEHPAMGSNCMNDFNVRRATMGLTRYLQSLKPAGEKAHVVFAHDTRHFSRHFAELAAQTVIECGGMASLFESERSTPELSFAVRQLRADGGVVITASHNPSHDNGFKAYFRDGAQVVDPHAGKIIEQVQSIPFDKVCAPFSSSPNAIQRIGQEMDQAYAARLKSLILDPELVSKTGSKLKVVYSPLHGTGAKIVPGLLKELGFDVLSVCEQMNADGNFSTVKSPNPENAEALSMSVKLAGETGAELVLATDPDADRMGVAIRNTEGKMDLLTGNQVGSLLAYYRLNKLFEKGILNNTNRSRARLIKTVVTTDLQKAIAKKFGVGIPETLTGFKYIGAKLQKYEEACLKQTRLSHTAYLALSEEEKRAKLLEHSCYYVFGGEESYGYSAGDFVRDKDANAACLMFAELALVAKADGKTVGEYLDSIFSELGYYQEKLGQIVHEGADGSRKIQNILQSYETNPPREFLGDAVVKVDHYGRDSIQDEEGEILPKERLLFVSLKSGTRYAVRGSGTEPKIKFYLFASEIPLLNQRFDAAGLKAAKSKIADQLARLWLAIEKDAAVRAASANT